jgi:LacI family transcriptional regulator
MATINDVAVLAGVSKKTVSRVMNNEENVRAQTRELVQKAMRELNYFPNMSARNLASKRSQLICLLYDNVDNYVFQQFQSYLLELLSARGYALILLPCVDDSEQALLNVEHKARYMNIDGFVLMPPLADAKPLVDLLKSLSKPYVRITPTDNYDGFTEVLCDDEQAAFGVTTHLIAQGHRGIGFVRGHAHCLSSLTRLMGYQRALFVAGIALNSDYLVDGTYSFESGQQAAKQLLTRADRPTAIFCSNDDMAAGVLSVAHDMGLAIPHDLAVAGYDNSPLAQKTWPALTSVQLPNKAMVEVATNKLLDAIAGDIRDDYPQHLPCDIFYRSSSMLLPATRSSAITPISEDV